MLEMGEPVRVLDMAHNLIRLYGYEPGQDIEVKIIGLRPGREAAREPARRGRGSRAAASRRSCCASGARAPPDRRCRDLMAGPRAEPAPARPGGGAAHPAARSFPPSSGRCPLRCRRPLGLSPAPPSRSRWRRERARDRPRAQRVEERAAQERGLLPRQAAARPQRRARPARPERGPGARQHRQRRATARSPCAAGAEVPFLRPADAGRRPLHRPRGLRPRARLARARTRATGPRSACTCARPTPTRRVEDVENAVDLLLSDPDRRLRALGDRGAAHALQDVAAAARAARCARSWRARCRESYNLPRQVLPDGLPAERRGRRGARAPSIRERHSMTGTRVAAPTSWTASHDIDDWSELAAAGARRRPTTVRPPACTFAFDLDGVIAGLVPDNDYARAEPLPAGVAVVNRLHDARATAS